MSNITELLEVTETLLKWIIGERDFLREKFSYQFNDVFVKNALAGMDEKINKAQAVINKVKQEKENAA